jgi:DNA polymerase-3 subunit epsilon
MLASNADVRQKAIQKAIAWLEEKPVFLDTETTGLTNADEIVEIAVIDHDGQTLINELVKPSRKIPYDATQIHGITDEMVSGALKFPIAWATKVRPALFGRTIAIYNAGFDLRMMAQSHGGSQDPFRTLRILDVMELYARFYGEWDAVRRSYRYQSLDKAGKQCEIALPNAHRALADVLLTRAVLIHMANAS